MDDGPTPLELARERAAALEREGRWLDAADACAAIMVEFPFGRFGMPWKFLDLSLRGGRSTGEAYRRLAEILDGWDREASSIAALSAWQCLSAFRPDDPEPALAAAERLAQWRDPLESRVYYQRAYEAYLKRGDEQAAAALKARVTFGPGDLDAAFVRRTVSSAEAAANRGRVAEAEAGFGTVLERFPDSIPAHEGLRKLYFDQARFAEASREGRILADLYHRSGDPERAAAAAREAERTRPDNPQLWAERGAVLMRKGQTAEAADAYRRAVRLDAACADAWFGLGSAYHWLVDRDGVFECHRRLVDLDASRAEAFEAEYVEAERGHPAREIAFPPGCTIGSLSARDSRATWNLAWRPLGPARGVIRVPPCKEVRLVADYGLRHDLTPLARLAPNDVQELDLSDIKLADDDLRHCARLTGLRRLSLSASDMAWAGLDDDPFIGYGMPLACLGELWEGYGLTDAALVHLRNLTDLEELKLDTSAIADAGLAYLAGLRRLQALNLNRTAVSDRGLASLKPLVTLRALHLDRTRVTDAGLADLLACLPHLSRLAAAGTRICGDALQALPRPDLLRSLDLGRTRFDPATLSHLGELHHLCLDASSLEDADLRHLASLTELRVLDIADTAVTDAGLAHLTSLRHLERLEVWHSKVTEKGLADLRRALGRPSLTAPLDAHQCDWFDRL